MGVFQNQWIHGITKTFLHSMHATSCNCSFQNVFPKDFHGILSSGPTPLASIQWWLGVPRVDFRGRQNRWDPNPFLSSILACRSFSLYKIVFVSPLLQYPQIIWRCSPLLSWSISLLSFTYSLWEGDRHVEHCHKDCQCWFPRTSGDRIDFFRCRKSIRGNFWSIPALHSSVSKYIYISYRYSGHMNQSRKQIKTLGSHVLCRFFHDRSWITYSTRIYEVVFWNCSCWCLG